MLEITTLKRAGTTVACILIVGSVFAQQTASAAAGDTETVLAKVNGVPIYQSRLELIEKLAGLQDSAANRSTLEKELIESEVVRQAAEKAGYGDRAEVKQTVNAAKAKAESDLYVRDSVQTPPVTDQQIRARYDEMVAAAGDQEYQPRIISVADDATANQVLAQLNGGQDFSDVARQYSQASNRAEGGAMGWVTFKTPVREGKTSGLPLPLAQALMQLKPGTYTPAPVQLGTARVIVKLDAERPTKVLPFDKVKDQIRQQMEATERQNAIDAFVVKLVKQAHVEQ